MNLKKIGRAAAVGVGVSLVLGGGLIPSAANAESAQPNITSGATYYVSASGDDGNEGTSEDAPFKTLDKVNTLTLHAGDRVLLKRGDTFNNQYLCVSGDEDFELNDGKDCAFQADSDGAPLVISSYGEAAGKPVIAANGAGKWKLDYGLSLVNSQHYLAKDAVSSAVILKDAENIELTDLEITNKRVEDDQGKEEGCAYNDDCALDRTGVAGLAQNKGTLDHVLLKDLYVHDVQGNVYNKHTVNGAVYFSALIASDKMASEDARKGGNFTPDISKPENGYPRFNDLSIVDNRVENSSRWGIAGVYSAYGVATLDSKAEIADADIAKYGSTNVVMSRNFLKNIGADAITAMYAYRPVIESNVATDIAAQMNDTDYLFKYGGNNGADTSKPIAGNETKFPKTGGRVAASIWPWKSKNAVFRFNEGFNTLGADHGNGDGMPWDADSGDGTLYEYNYSANNSGGTVMFCGDQAANSTFRFNIAQGDKMGALSPTFWGDDSYNNVYPNAHVYNNTFYLKEGASILHPAQGQQGTMKVENNIFYWDEDTPRNETWTVKTMTWDPALPDGTLQVTYSNNLYYNFANLPQDDAAVKVDKGTPVFVDPGKAPTAPADTMQARQHYFPQMTFGEADKQTTEFDGYKLSDSSPAIGKGKAIQDMNGFALGTDFFGRAANTYDIGAVSTNHGAPVAEEAKLVSTIYQVTSGAQPDGAGAPHKNSGYAAGDTLHVPSTKLSPSTVAEVLANIDAEGTAEIVDGAGAPQDSDAQIAEGMKLTLTGGNGASAEFPIVIDNSYSWLDDYTYDVQGNVWFAHKQDGADGDWVNIASSDPAWPNWVVDEYYGPGIDAADKAPANRSALHGLLSDSPKSEGGIAMAWRAPKSGYITVAVKDGEPYLRQGDATGGSVKVAVEINGEEKNSLTLETKGIRPEGDFGATAVDDTAVKVNKGDYVRIAAYSDGDPAQPSMHVSPTITYIDREGDTTVVPVIPEEEGEAGSGDPSIPSAPLYVEPKAPSFAVSSDESGAVTGALTVPQVEGVTYLVNGEAPKDTYPAGIVKVTAQPSEGYQFGESATTVWNFAVPGAPSFDSETGVLEVPTVEGVSYSESSKTVDAGESVTVTATPAEGYSFGATRSVVWSFSADDKPEQSEKVDPQLPSSREPVELDLSASHKPSHASLDTLSETGTHMVMLVGVAALLTVAGVVSVAYAARRRNG